MSLGIVGGVAGLAVEVPVAACSVVGGVVLAALTVSALKTSGVALPLLVCGGIAAFILGSAGTTIAAHGVILIAFAAIAVVAVAAALGLISAAAVAFICVGTVGAIIQGIARLLSASDSKPGPDLQGEPA